MQEFLRELNEWIKEAERKGLQSASECDCFNEVSREEAHT